MKLVGSWMSGCVVQISWDFWNHLKTIQWDFSFFWVFKFPKTFEMLAADITRTTEAGHELNIFSIFWKYLISYFLGITLVPTSLWWDNGFRLLHVFIWKFATLSFISIVTGSTETRWTPPASLRGKPKISKLGKYNFGNQTCWYQIEDGPCLEICDFANWLRGQAPKLEKLFFFNFQQYGCCLKD